MNNDYDSITDDIVSSMAENLAREIDTMVLMEALGWEMIEVSEGRVYGSRYHIVAPTSGESWDNMLAWCVDKFGPTLVMWSDDKAPQPNCRWYVNNAKFWFRTEEDLTLFLLRWS